MQNRPYLRWLLPAALTGVLAFAATDAILLRHRPVPLPAGPAIPENIGLTADVDGDALQLQWNRRARPIRDADHAILYIHDGTHQSQLDLTSQQLNSASVRYWPESTAVTFRMEAYTGTARTTESVQVPVASPLEKQPVPAAPRSLVVKNPSPFERVRPEIIRRKPPLPAPVVARAIEMEPPRTLRTDPVEPHHESGISRVVSKIPLLRRLTKHRQSDVSAPPPDNEPRL
jgi:hypothetical protein